MDNGARLLRAGPWLWDWQSRWGVTLFKMDKKLCFCVLACCAEESTQGIFTYGWARCEATEFLSATLPELRFVKRFYSLFLSDNASKIGQLGRSSPWQAEASLLS